MVGACIFRESYLNCHVGILTVDSCEFALNASCAIFVIRAYVSVDTPVRAASRSEMAWREPSSICQHTHFAKRKIWQMSKRTLLIGATSSECIVVAYPLLFYTSIEFGPVVGVWLREGVVYTLIILVEIDAPGVHRVVKCGWFLDIAITGTVVASCGSPWNFGMGSVWSYLLYTIIW